MIQLQEQEAAAYGHAILPKPEPRTGRRYGVGVRRIPFQKKWFTNITGSYIPIRALL